MSPSIVSGRVVATTISFVTFDGRVSNLPDATVLFLGLDFEISDSGLQLRIPVDEPLAAIDQLLFV